MTNLIGGLFKTQEDANLAYNALQKSGFTDQQINTFVRKPRESTARSTEVRVQDIAKNAVFGGVIVAILGGIIGFLVGTGIVPLPGLGPGDVQLNGLFLFSSIVWGLVAGGLTGMILGVAWKLVRSREKAEVTTRQIRKGGVLITVNADGNPSETKARRVLEEHKALEVGDPAEKWDLEAWSNPNEKDPSLKNLAKTR